MKAKRILSVIIALAMIIASMGTVALAADDSVVLPDGITADSFGDNTVTDGINYWATLQAAVEAIDAAKTSGAVLYCKPDSNVGYMYRAPVCSTLTIYGNGASVSDDTDSDTFDIGNVDPSYGADITADMTFTVKNLSGWGAWGSKSTEYTVDLVFENCSDMGKVFISGTTGTLNIALTSCSFNDNTEADGCAFYSNADGAITLTDVAFSNVAKAVNLNHKAAGTQTVTLTDCTFTDCGNNVASDEIPVRVLSSVEGGVSNLTVSGCSFSGTPEGGADILLDYGVGTTNASVTSTAAKILPENADGNADMVVVAVSDTYTLGEPVDAEKTIVAKIGDDEYETLQEAIDAAQPGDTITIVNDIELDKGVNIAADDKIILDLNGHTIFGTCVSSQQYMFMVKNGAELTIKDSDAEQKGKITYAGNNSTGWIVDVEGELVLESGTLELTGTWDIGYTVDVRPNSWGDEYTEATTFTMKGGKLVSSKDAVRVASSSAETHENVSASFVMNGGIIEDARDGVFVQQSNTVYDALSVTINAGSIIAKRPIRIYGPVPTEYPYGKDCMNINLNGGTLTSTGEVAGSTYTWLMNGVLAVAGGATVDNVLDSGDITVSQDFAENLTFAEGYTLVENADGTYGVAEKTWATDTDAGYYLVGETKTGLMRFLFAYDIDAGKIVKSGIKYLKSSSITDFVDSQETVEGAAPAFYGDITGIEEAEYTDTYYAVAYLETTDGGFFWSEAVGCTPSFENHFENYPVEVAE